MTAHGELKYEGTITAIVKDSKTVTADFSLTVTSRQHSGTDSIRGWQVKYRIHNNARPSQKKVGSLNTSTLAANSVNPDTMRAAISPLLLASVVSLPWLDTGIIGSNISITRWVQVQ